MTYDELLSQVKDNPTTLAVVKLHKPWICNEKESGCQAEQHNYDCVEYGDSEDCPLESYPCPTILAIEKELTHAHL